MLFGLDRREDLQIGVWNIRAEQLECEMGDFPINKVKGQKIVPICKYLADSDVTIL